MKNQTMLLGSVLVVTLTSLSVSAQTSGTLKAGVVRIRNQVTRQNGTGFITQISDNEVYIVTVDHVVGDDRNPQVQFFGQTEPVMSTVQLKRKELDLAVIVVSKKGNRLPADIRPLLISASTVSGGENVEVIGHPENRPAWSVIKGSIEAERGGFIAFSGNLDQGVSGGPIILNGQVIGLVKEGGLSEKGVTSRAIPAKILSGFLQGVVPAPPDEIELAYKSLHDTIQSPAFASAIRALINASSNGFKSIKGPFARTDQYGDRIYLSTIALPGATESGDLFYAKTDDGERLVSVSYRFDPGAAWHNQALYDEIVQIVRSLLPTGWTNGRTRVDADHEKFVASKGTRGPSIEVTFVREIWVDIDFKPSR